MKSLRVNKKWVRDFEKAQTYTEDLEILFDFYNAMELLPAPPFVSTTMATP
jgi:peptide chain release factor 2